MLQRVVQVLHRFLQRFLQRVVQVLQRFLQRVLQRVLEQVLQRVLPLVPFPVDLILLLLQEIGQKCSPIVFHQIIPLVIMVRLLLEFLLILLPEFHQVVIVPYLHYFSFHFWSLILLLFRANLYKFLHFFQHFLYPYKVLQLI